MPMKCKPEDETQKEGPGQLQEMEEAEDLWWVWDEEEEEEEEEGESRKEREEEWEAEAARGGGLSSADDFDGRWIGDEKLLGFCSRVHWRTVWFFLKMIKSDEQ